MSWLRRLERRLRPLAIPNLTLVLIAGMVVVYLFLVVDRDLVDMFVMRPRAVLAGEWWRLLTFLFIPGVDDPLNPVTLLFFVLGMMCLNFMGSALEASWGTLRYNVFILVAYLSSIGSAVLMAAVLGGDPPASNMYLYGSIFLAFAWLFPDFQILLFFILPVKVKWIALITVVLFVIEFLQGLASFTQGGWLKCVLILAANLNLSLFLGREIADRLRNSNRQMLRKFAALSQVKTARHTCCVCGATELTHPEREFRYCTQCEGTPGYCDFHLVGHQHRQKVETPAESPEP